MATQQECSRRIGRLQAELQRQELDGALLAYPIDIYYFAGTRQNALLWVPAAGQATLLVRKSLARARQEGCIDDIRPFPSSKELPGVLGAGCRRVGVTCDVLPVQQMQFLSKVFPSVEFVDIAALNRELRSVKSEWELAKMAQSAQKIGAVSSSTGRAGSATKGTCGCAPSTRSFSRGSPSPGRAPPPPASSTAR